MCFKLAIRLCYPIKNVKNAALFHRLMSDIQPGPNPLFLRDEELRRGMELLFYAYQAFTSEPDQMLARLGMGRAHHRVIYFVGRHPGMTVSELLAILRITKQSLSRVLGRLVEEGYVEQRPGQSDRRQRCLHLTAAGRALESELTAPQRELFARAYRHAGASAVEGFRVVLQGIVDEEVPRGDSTVQAARRGHG